MELSPAARAVRERLFRDFEFYAQHSLFIRTKDQKVIPLILNKAQRLLLEAVNRQLERRGFVRLIILKGRQMGRLVCARDWGAAPCEINEIPAALPNENGQWTGPLV